MTDRRQHRRHEPESHPLEYAKAAQEGIAAAESERDRAFLSAAKAGWTLREIGEATGMAASTALRAILRAEESRLTATPSRGVSGVGRHGGTASAGGDPGD